MVKHQKWHESQTKRHHVVSKVGIFWGFLDKIFSVTMEKKQKTKKKGTSILSIVGIFFSFWKLSSIVIHEP